MLRVTVFDLKEKSHHSHQVDVDAELAAAEELEELKAQITQALGE
jgi:hypothetical protein